MGALHRKNVRRVKKLDKKYGRRGMKALARGSKGGLKALHRRLTMATLHRRDMGALHPGMGTLHTKALGKVQISDPIYNGRTSRT